MIEFLLDFPIMVSPISAGGRCGCLFICSSRPSCLRWAILRFQWIGWEIWTRNHDVDPQMICVLLQVPDFLFSSSNSGMGLKQGSKTRNCFHCHVFCRMSGNKHDPWLSVPHSLFFRVLTIGQGCSTRYGNGRRVAKHPNTGGFPLYCQPRFQKFAKGHLDVHLSWYAMRLLVLFISHWCAMV